MPNVPHWSVPIEPVGWADRDATALLAADWSGIDRLPPLIRSDGSRQAEQQTVVRLCASGERLSTRFDCEDRDIWGTLKDRDDPIYDEEVVELFLAPGNGDPSDYFEFEVSPDGVLFDATIHNPDANRFTMKGDPAWDCEGIDWAARRFDSEQRWEVILTIPWRGIHASPQRFWRANVFRIERPRDSEPEYSCWSPTLITPADFHIPACFGRLEIEAIAAR